MSIKTDFKDDVYSGARKYQIINNGDGTSSLLDATQYTQQGDFVGANELNAIAKNVKNAAYYEKAGGTATAITLANVILEDGCQKTFIVTANNSGAATTLNGKHFYKPGTTNAPTLKVGKAVSVWYDVTGDCFFIKASAEGDAVAANVLATKKFSNDDDTGLIGSMTNNGAVNQSLAINGNYTIPEGYHNGSGKVTQSITSKAAATYNPSTSAQTIASGQYLSGAQTIAATTGTAAVSDVISGKTFNSANGIGLTGTIPIVNPDYGDQVSAVGSNVGAYSGDGLNYAYLNYPFSGKYNNGANWIRKYEPDLKASNILSGKSIMGVAGSAIQGKRVQSGTVASGGSVGTFAYTDGNALSRAYVTVSGLTFLPSLIVIKYTVNYEENLTVYDTMASAIYPKTFKLGRWAPTDSSYIIYNIKADLYAAYVNATGFQAPVYYFNTNYSWIAYE